MSENRRRRKLNYDENEEENENENDDDSDEDDEEGDDDDEYDDEDGSEEEGDHENANKDQVVGAKNNTGGDKRKLVENHDNIPIQQISNMAITNDHEINDNVEGKEQEKTLKKERSSKSREKEKVTDPFAVPRGTRFFLHDDRKIQGKVQAPKNNKIDDIDWKHDKFDELFDGQEVNKKSTRNNNRKPQKNSPEIEVEAQSSRSSSVYVERELIQSTRIDGTSRRGRGRVVASVRGRGRGRISTPEVVNHSPHEIEHQPPSLPIMKNTTLIPSKQISHSIPEPELRSNETGRRGGRTRRGGRGRGPAGYRESNMPTAEEVAAEAEAEAEYLREYHSEHTRSRGAVQVAGRGSHREVYHYLRPERETRKQQHVQLHPHQQHPPQQQQNHPHHHHRQRQQQQHHQHELEQEYEHGYEQDQSRWQWDEVDYDQATNSHRHDEYRERGRGGRARSVVSRGRGSRSEREVTYRTSRSYEEDTSQEEYPGPSDDTSYYPPAHSNSSDPYPSPSSATSTTGTSSSTLQKPLHKYPNQLKATAHEFRPSSKDPDADINSHSMDEYHQSPYLETDRVASISPDYLTQAMAPVPMYAPHHPHDPDTVPPPMYWNPNHPPYSHPGYYYSPPPYHHHHHPSHIPYHHVPVPEMAAHPSYPPHSYDPYLYDSTHQPDMETHQYYQTGTHPGYYSTQQH